MRVISGWRDFPKSLLGGAYALGSFDGVHRGHVAVIDSLRAHVSDAERGLGVLCFEPPTRRFFRPDAPPFRLTTPLLRARALQRLGVSVLAEIPFDADLASMNDRDFVETVLVAGLGVAHVATGFDFRFGYKRLGDNARLLELARKFGFGAHVEAQVGDEAGEKISATGIREALVEGDLAQANFMLGREWAVEGVIERGEQRGRSLGFATANMRLGDQLPPKLGVYATRIELLDDQDRLTDPYVAKRGTVYPAISNFGRTPTFGAREALLETHIFDFDQELYGRRAIVSFSQFLRAEQKFDNVEALRTRIAKDCDAARLWLAACPPP